jgi:CBS domain-containing protein
VRRIALDECDLRAPVAAVMTSGLITLPADSTAHTASVVMVRRNVHHLVLTEADGRYYSLVSQSDLYALPGGESAELVRAILAAQDLETLTALAGEVRAFVAHLVVRRVSAETLCQHLSSLNDLLTLQVIELIAGHFDLPYVEWCWLVFGSEGRLEQTLSTDQDNGLIFAAESDEEAALLRAAFLPFARAVNEALDACGFPLCKGNIMASNPQWCLSAEQWRAAFSTWLESPEPEALLNSSIFFDFRALYGQDSLASELRAWLLARAGSYPIFLRGMVENTMNWESPLTWWKGFRYDDDKDFPHTIDLKKHGTRPFVDAARIYALAQGIPDTNTVERLRLAGEKIGLAAPDLAAQIAAFQHIQRFRLNNHVQGSTADAANRLDPDTLHELDRLILREALKQVQSVQRRLRRDFMPT